MTSAVMTTAASASNFGPVLSRVCVWCVLMCVCVLLVCVWTFCVCVCVCVCLCVLCACVLLCVGVCVFVCVCVLVLHLSLVFALVYLCSLTEGQQYVQLPHCTTERNHSYYAGSSFSASHSVQQLQNCTITNSVQPLASIQEVNGAASSGFVSSPPLPCSTISSQVPVCPTRNVTGDVMPLAEAITQLSFLEFLQRCGVLTAPPQPS